MVKRVAFGDIKNPQVSQMSDINSREYAILAVLAVFVLFMGVYPQPFTEVMHVSVQQLLEHVAQSKL